MAELADAPDLGSGVPDVQVRFLSSAYKKDTLKEVSFFVVKTEKVTDVYKPVALTNRYRRGYNTIYVLFRRTLIFRGEDRRESNGIGGIQMSKKIGVKITVMMVAMTIMYLITSVASGFAQEQALGGMNRVYNSWVALERYETKQYDISYLWRILRRRM